MGNPLNGSSLKYSIKSSAGTGKAQSGGSSPTSSVVSNLTIMSVVKADEVTYTCRMSGENSAELMGTVQVTVITPTPSSASKFACKH